MLRAHKTRIRNANPGSSIARALSQYDGATRWAYNALLARLNGATQASTAGALWPSVDDLAKTLRREKPEWWATIKLYRCHLCGWQCDRDKSVALKQVAPALWATIKRRGGDVSPAPGPATASEASIVQGNHWQPPCFLVDGEIMAGHSDYAKSWQSES